MKDGSKSLTVKFPILVLLVAVVPAAASAFCFSFGSRSNDNARYSPYMPPLPGVMTPAYPGYGYGQALPAYYYGSAYYPPALPYATVPLELPGK